MKIIAWLIIGAVAFLHGAYSSPWLFNHGSSAAFDLAMGLWVGIVAALFWSSITLPWGWRR